MIEEAGRVVEVRDEFAWIETTPMTACNSCSARSGCGTPVLAKVLGRRNSPLRVANRIGVVVGDRVVIGIAESGLVRGSFAVYFAPLAACSLVPPQAITWPVHPGMLNRQVYLAR